MKITNLVCKQMRYDMSLLQKQEGNLCVLSSNLLIINIAFIYDVQKSCKIQMSILLELLMKLCVNCTKN